MWLDWRYEYDEFSVPKKLANDDDVTICEWKEDRCCHRHWKMIRKPFPDYDEQGRLNGKVVMCDTISCESCGFEEPYCCDGDSSVSNVTPEQQLRHYIPPYSQEPVLAAALRRQIEGIGWRVVINRRGSGASCTLSKGDVSVTAGPGTTEEAVISQAVASLVRRRLLPQQA